MVNKDVYYIFFISFINWHVLEAYIRIYAFCY